MPPAEFEPKIPEFERAKTVHALDRAATVMGIYSLDFRITNKYSRIKFFKIKNTIRKNYYKSWGDFPGGGDETLWEFYRMWGLGDKVDVVV
jgi:hypothetical protein